MDRRPLRALGVLITVLGVALLIWVMQRGVEAAPREVAAVAAPSESPSATVASPTLTPTTTRPPSAPPRPTAVPPKPVAKPKRTSTPAATPQKTSTPPAARGLRLRIPAIGLERSMSGRGLSNGKINPPPGTVMWFTGYDRVKPGRTGTSVIAAHVSIGGRPDAFARLSRVGVGDRIQVVQADGDVLNYTVTRARAIDKTTVTTDRAVWGSNGSRSRLAIITCDDAFGFRSDGHLKANYVVIAERR